MLDSRRETMSILMATAVTQTRPIYFEAGHSRPVSGRVVAVNSENSIISGVYQPEYHQKT